MHSCMRAGSLSVDARGSKWGQWASWRRVECECLHSSRFFYSGARSSSGMGLQSCWHYRLLLKRFERTLRTAPTHRDLHGAVLTSSGTMAAVSRLSRAGLQSLVGSIIKHRPVRGMGGAAHAAMDVEVWSLPVPSVDDVQKQNESRGPQWVFLGCPGVGKGTYASRLSKLLDVPHIAMGDLVRNELKGSSPLSKQLLDAMKAGKLLPDEVIFNLLSRRLEQGLAAGEKGFILDGFPRTITQAEVLEDVVDIDLVVNLKLQQDVLISKCLGRRICSQCGGNFNLAKIDFKGEDGAPNIFMPPLLPPPSCASKMTVRADDTDEVVRARLRVYQEESAPVEEFYLSRVGKSAPLPKYGTGVRFSI
ncbi:hypothetical protein R1flu_023651 [Riccia fluitans]|uniref:adenylate kinase n=1 Tax=Riccia fluitans TaxID=41844 RepID=A0ABD1XSM2_9MARC